jgi:hypothetical protein
MDSAPWTLAHRRTNFADGLSGAGADRVARGLRILCAWGMVQGGGIRSEPGAADLAWEVAGWAAQLSRKWMKQDPASAGTLYVDGHVRRRILHFTRILCSGSRLTLKPILNSTRSLPGNQIGSRPLPALPPPRSSEREFALTSAFRAGYHTKLSNALNPQLFPCEYHCFPGFCLSFLPNEIQKSGLKSDSVRSGSLTLDNKNARISIEFAWFGISEKKARQRRGSAGQLGWLDN